MRKVKRPNLAVKPREVFYHLKRQKQLGSLTEEAIQDILLKDQPGNLVDPACLYDHWAAQEIVDWEKLSLGKGRTATGALATVGDKGFEAALGRLNGDAHAQERRLVLWGWAEALLAKLADFTNGMIQEEASAESLELGAARSLDTVQDTAVIHVLWERLSPEAKIGVRRVEEGGAMRLTPVLTRAWLIPWITKKEKKQLAAQGA